MKQQNFLYLHKITVLVWIEFDVISIDIQFNGNYLETTTVNDECIYRLTYFHPHCCLMEEKL